MASFELIFEEDEDVLEATFETFDDTFSRTIPLNENIVLYTDLGFSSGWGITFYDYTQLLQVSETHLDNLSQISEADRNKILRVLSSPPISYFLQILSADSLRALVKAPTLTELFG